MSFWLNLFAITLLCVGTAAGADLYYTIAPIEAWVVDAETGAPIEGAAVTANWQLVGFGFDTGGRKLGQLEVMETVTDKAGRFFFPGFTKVNISGNVLREEDPQILIFKSGYRYMRVASDYPIGKEGEQGPNRKSAANGQKLKMQRADEDVKKYAFNLQFLSSYLSRLAEGGGSRDIPRMIRALGCERQRLVDRDPTIGLSVPGATALEVNCDAK